MQKGPDLHTRHSPLSANLIFGFIGASPMLQLIHIFTLAVADADSAGMRVSLGQDCIIGPALSGFSRQIRATNRQLSDPPASLNEEDEAQLISRVRDNRCRI